MFNYKFLKIIKIYFKDSKKIKIIILYKSKPFITKIVKIRKLYILINELKIINE